MVLYVFVHCKLVSYVSLIMFLLGIFVFLSKVTFITHLCVLRLTLPYLLHLDTLQCVIS